MNEEFKSVLPTLRDHHVVIVHNPLMVDFTQQIARTVVQLDQDKIDPYIDKAGLRNDGHPTNKHVTQMVTIESGKTKKLPGSVAQVVVKHLIDAMMMTAGHKSTLSDPFLRGEYEKQIIINIDDLKSTLSTKSIEDQLNEQIDNLNKEEETHVETAFPSVTESGTGTSELGTTETSVATSTRPAKK